MVRTAKMRNLNIYLICFGVAEQSRYGTKRPEIELDCNSELDNNKRCESSHDNAFAVIEIAILILGS
jgi:hypothetical protein